MNRSARLSVLLASVISLPAAAQPSSDTAGSTDLSNCRGMAVENFILDMIGVGRITTENLNKFCDEYGELDRTAKSLELAKTAAAAELEANNKAIASLQGAVSALQIQLTSAVGRLPPEDSILTVDDELCPTGWEDVTLLHPEIFAGRTIVVAGNHPSRVARPFRATGGEETHTLTTEEAPAHSHKITFPMSDDLGDSSQFRPDYDQPRFRTGSATSDRWTTTVEKTVELSPEAAAHNNMPPFVALTFCRLKPN